MVNVCADQNIRLKIFTRGGSNYSFGTGFAIENWKSSIDAVHLTLFTIVLQTSLYMYMSNAFCN